MRYNSKAGNLIPKLLCGIAGVSLVVFFLLKKEEAPSNAISTTNDEMGFVISAFPFTTSKTIHGQEKVHIYQTSFPVDAGTIVEAALKESGDGIAALYISDAGGTLNYSKKGKIKGEEEAALTFFNGGMASIIVELTKPYGSYALSVDTKGMERLVETLPYTSSGYMSQTDAEGGKWHWYQIASSVSPGTVISANLSVTGNANMDVTIFVDRDTVTYGANHGVGENEHAELTIEKDSKVYVIIDNLEGEGNYSLTITGTVPTKP